MKLVRKHLEKDKSGEIVLVAEDAEDLWHIYNIVMRGNTIRASTVR